MTPFTTAYNFNPEDFKGDVNELPSETIEGQSLSVNEVLIRFSRGTLPNIQFPTEYDGIESDLTFDMDDPTLRPDFDLSDTDYIHEVIAEAKQPNKSAKENEHSTTETKGTPESSEADEPSDAK